MKNVFYQFVRQNNNALVFRGCFDAIYAETSRRNGYVVYLDTEIEKAKDDFKVAKDKVVKSGKTWLSSDFAKKLLKHK